MKITALIALLFLTSCASIPFTPTTIPNVLISYDCEISQTDKDSLYNTIISAQAANPTETIYINITEYHSPSNLNRFLGFKDYSIKGTITYKSTTKHIKSRISNIGIPLSTLIAGIPGIIISTANLTRNMQNVQSALAKSIWKHTRNINKTHQKAGK